MISSLPEKKKAFQENGYVEHWMYVHELQKLLNELHPDDWITPNDVHNLCVGRDDDGCIAAINFRWNEIEWWNE